MRVHLSQQVIILLRGLKEEGSPLRRAVEALEQNPIPPDVLVIDDRTGRYEQFVRVGNDGYWIHYEVDTSGMETVVRVTLIEKN